MITGDKELIEEMINKQLKILAIVMSERVPESGVLFMGRDIKKGESPEVNIYLVHKEVVGYRVEEKLRVYKFKELEDANFFIEQASKASGLSFLLILSGQAPTRRSGKEKRRLL